MFTTQRIWTLCKNEIGCHDNSFEQEHALKYTILLSFFMLAFKIEQNKTLFQPNLRNVLNLSLNVLIKDIFLMFS